MDGWALVAGAAISGLVGVGVAWYQHRLDRKATAQDQQRDALLELARVLLPLLVELERPLQSHGYWVRDVRELRRLGTWIVDPEENAQQAPDWDRIKVLVQEVERRWWGDLQARMKDPQMRSLREEFYDAGLYVAMPDAAQPTISLARLAKCVEATLDCIGEVTGSGLRVAGDRPPRYAAPEGSIPD